MSWLAIGVLTAGAFAFKAAGWFGLGRLVNGPRSVAMGQLLPPALLGALIVVSTVASGPHLTLDARLPGVALGGLAAWKGAPFWLVVLIAAVVTAAVRAI